MAELIIKNKVSEYSKRINITPAAVRVTTAATRWGLCSGKNSINFSWRLVMADDDVIDYVAAHELALGFLFKFYSIFYTITSTPTLLFVYLLKVSSVDDSICFLLLAEISSNISNGLLKYFSNIIYTSNFIYFVFIYKVAKTIK